ncbi:MAG: GntR family transcriptional regulator [Burkholderiaceae bacterium]
MTPRRPPRRPQAARIEAYERFCRQVLEGHLAPGQFVSQRELVELLEMPLGAVREMIPRLEAARLIVTVPKRGLQVATVGLELIRNAFQVRAMIEREAISHYVHVATDTELDELERRHRALLARAESGTPDPTLDADARDVDWGTHYRMIDSMGNEILTEIFRVNSMHVRMITLDSSQVVSRRVRPAMLEHLKFIDALRKRDLDGAIRALDEHIENSRQRVIDASVHRRSDAAPGAA